MSEQENLQALQRAYKAFFDGDIRPMVNLSAEDVESIAPFGPTMRGRREVEQYFKIILERLEFEVYQADEYIVARDAIVVLGHEKCRVRATGRVVEADWAQIHRFRDGLIIWTREYSDTAAWKVAIDEAMELAKN